MSRSQALAIQDEIVQRVAGLSREKVHKLGLACWYAMHYADGPFTNPDDEIRAALVKAFTEEG